MQKNSMATAALTFGIMSFVLGLFGGIGLFWGALGLTFALLSRTEKMETPAIIGLFTSIAGCVISILMLIFSILLIMNSPELKEVFEKSLDYYYNGGGTL